MRSSVTNAFVLSQSPGSLLLVFSCRFYFSDFSSLFHSVFEVGFIGFRGAIGYN